MTDTDAGMSDDVPLSYVTVTVYDPALGAFTFLKVSVPLPGPPKFCTLNPPVQGLHAPISAPPAITFTEEAAT